MASEKTNKVICKNCKILLKHKITEIERTKGTNKEKYLRVDFNKNQRAFISEGNTFCSEKCHDKFYAKGEKAE